ncbi:MAG TPA: DUF58 domain-containing protein [bacterium]|nr:DUF58 domain-containing protein [bacterium]
MARRWAVVFLTFAVLLYVAAPMITSNFAYILAALYALAAVLLWPGARPRVAAELLLPRRAVAGRPAPVSVRLRGRMWLPRLAVVVEPLLPETLLPALQPRAWQLRLLPPRGERSMTAELRPPRRGVFPVAGVRLLQYGFAGMAARTATAGGEQELIVHPRAIDELPVRDLLAGRLTALGQRYIPARSGEEFHALREYRPGDPLRRIHWRTTARTGELMVVVAETPALEAPEVWLDTGMAASPAFEYDVRVAATLIDYLTATTGCSLRAGAARREPGAGAGARQAMLDILARVAAGEPAAEPAANAIIITVPGRPAALAPPAQATVIVNDLWSPDGGCAAAVVCLSSLKLVRDDGGPPVAGRDVRA